MAISLLDIIAPVAKGVKRLAWNVLISLRVVKWWTVSISDISKHFNVTTTVAFDL